MIKNDRLPELSAGKSQVVSLTETRFCLILSLFNNAA